MTTFETKVAGIPCQCEVTLYYVPEYHSNYGAAPDPPDPLEFEFNILDRKGYPASWLEAKLTSNDADRLLEEFENRKHIYQEQ